MVKSEKKQIKIKINNKSVSINEGDFVLQTALDQGFDIPHFCHHPDLPVEGSCRACLIEVVNKDRGNFVTTSCTLKAKEGLEILLDTKEVSELRKKNMELLFASHKENCSKCKDKIPCRANDVMKKYRITGKEYGKDGIAGKNEIHRMADAAEFDPSLCIDCNLCVKACHKIGIDFLKLEGEGSKRRITYNKDPKVDCIYCGQCTTVCPVNAIREQNQIKEVIEVLKDKSKIVIVQTAPSVRASIGEEFGMGFGVNCEKKLNTAYRKLGFDKVFDVNFGADITTYVEAEELTERLQNEEVMGIGHKLPMFTSCCPGWVKTAEFYYPELLDNLTTARSPQIHSGGAYKTWWAEKEGIDPERIVVVSTMPCTSKKYEAKMEELNVNGHRPVDYVLTTRELAALMKIKSIDFANLEDSEADKYALHSGAAAIYGASGGVMESALRTAYKNITGENLKHFELKKVRADVDGIRTAEINMKGKKIRVAVAATPANMKTIIEEIRVNPEAYHYVECMACNGGCIGGGGQPNPSSNKIISQRIAALYKIDDKKKIRTAHDNPILQEFIKWVEKKDDKKLKDNLFYRSFKKKEKFE